MELLFIPSLLWGTGFTPCLTYQGMAKAATQGGEDAAILDQQLEGNLVLADSFRMSTRARLDIILSEDEALWELGTFAFTTLHLLPRVGVTCQPPRRSFASFRGCRRFIEMCRG